MKYISHLDLCQAWERTLRRARMPLAYSQGFHPQPKLQLAAALPVGYTSVAEVMDMILYEPVSLQELEQLLLPVLPKGLVLVAVEQIDLRFPSLQSTLRQAEYRVTVETSLPAEELTRRIASFLAADRFEHQRVRKGCTEMINLRPLVHDVRLEIANIGEAILRMQVSAGQHGNVRPDTVLAALGLGGVSSHFKRISLLFEFDT